MGRLLLHANAAPGKADQSRKSFDACNSDVPNFQRNQFKRGTRLNSSNWEQFSKMNMYSIYIIGVELMCMLKIVNYIYVVGCIV
jgi:hypothetical protein